MNLKSAVTEQTGGWDTFSFPSPLPSPLYVFSLSSAGAHGWGKIRYQNSFQCFGGCTYLRSAAAVRVAETASLLYRRMPSCRTAPGPVGKPLPIPKTRRASPDQFRPLVQRRGWKGWRGGGGRRYRELVIYGRAPSQRSHSARFYFDRDVGGRCSYRDHDGLDRPPD